MLLLVVVFLVNIDVSSLVSNLNIEVSSLINSLNNGISSLLINNLVMIDLSVPSTLRSISGCLVSSLNIQGQLMIYSTLRALLDIVVCSLNREMIVCIEYHV